jgi:hypothetical protein
MTARHKGVAKLWLLNLFGNAALIAAVYFWLLLPDAHGWQVAASAVLALAVIFFGLWLRTGSFAYFRVAEFRDNATVWRAFRHSVRHIIALAMWAISLALLELSLFSLLRYTPQFGVWWWQKAPALRFGSPRTVSHAAQWLLWIMMVLLVLLWLPVGSTVAATGLKLSRIARSFRLLKRPQYWLWCIALIFVGVYVPCKLIWWIPNLETLRSQAWSAGLRFAAAYIVVISAWVALLLVIGDRLSKEDPLTVAPPNSNPTT